MDKTNTPYNSAYREAEETFFVDFHELDNYEDLSMEHIDLHKLHDNLFTLSLPRGSGFFFSGFYLYRTPVARTVIEREVQNPETVEDACDYLLRLRPGEEPDQDYVTIFKERYVKTTSGDFKRVSQRDFGFSELRPYIAYLSEFIEDKAQKKIRLDEQREAERKRAFISKADNFFRELVKNE